MVIMDFEWIENSRHEVCPTQLSALRVDPQWAVVDRFNARIKPFNPFFYQWNHVAFSGGEPRDFLYGESVDDAFERFFDWLKDSDSLCWWIDEPASLFSKFAEMILKHKMEQDLYIASPIVKRLFINKEKATGSPYKLLQKLNVERPSPEHCSANDVEAIRLVFQHLNVDIVWLYAGYIPTPYNTNAINPTKPVHKSAYLYDPKRNLLHVPSCKRTEKAELLHGYDSLSSCIKHRYLPCACCKNEYWEESAKRVQAVLDHSEYNYVYEKGSKVFHRPSCVHVKRIPYMDILGCVRYDTAIRKGLRPCGFCKPANLGIQENLSIRYIPKSTKKAHRKVELPPKDYGNANKEEAHWKTTRRLTMDERKALLRHEQAVKERRSTDYSSMTTEQRKDASVLTQPGFAFWAATGYSTFHVRKCVKLNHVSDLRGFARYQDAISAGLRPCKMCKPSNKDDLIVSVPFQQQARGKEDPSILTNLCERYGFQHLYKAPEYFIETPVGKWRLITNTVPVDVFHINLVKTPDNRTNYHKQHRLFLSLTDTFDYIRRHDHSLMDKQQMSEYNDKQIPIYRRRYCVQK